MDAAQYDMRSVRDLSKIKAHPAADEFRLLTDDEKARLRTSMSGGYDASKPIVLGMVGNRKTPVLVDGVQRRAMAVELEIEEIPVLVRPFKDNAEVIRFVFASNTARRHDPSEAAEWALAYAETLGLSLSAAAEKVGVSNQRVSEARKKASTDTKTRARVERKKEKVAEDEGVQAPESGKANGKAEGKDGRRYAKAKPTAEEQAELDRELFLLVDGAGVSYEQAAKTRGVSKSTVSAAVKRHQARVKAEANGHSDNLGDLREALTKGFGSAKRMKPETAFVKAVLLGIQLGNEYAPSVVEQVWKELAA